MLCTPLYPMVLLIIIPIKWLFHWEYTQHFQTNPLQENGMFVDPQRVGLQLSAHLVVFRGLAQPSISRPSKEEPLHVQRTRCFETQEVYWIQTHSSWRTSWFPVIWVQKWRIHHQIFHQNYGNFDVIIHCDWWFPRACKSLSLPFSLLLSAFRFVAPALTEWFQQFPRKTETPKLQGGHNLEEQLCHRTFKRFKMAVLLRSWESDTMFLARYFYAPQPTPKKSPLLHHLTTLAPSHQR